MKSAFRPENAIGDRIERTVHGVFSRFTGAHRIKFGGVVGKVTYLSAGCLGAAAVAIWEMGASAYTLAVVVALLAFAALIAHWILDYAKAQPALATLEGTDVLGWQQQVLASNGLPSPPTAEPVAGTLSVGLQESGRV